MQLRDREITHLEEIGDDAFGRVYKGFWGDRRVAVRSAEAFDQGALGDTTWLNERVQSVHHSALPTYYGVGLSKYPFLVMDFVDGADLNSQLGREIGEPLIKNFLWCTRTLSGALAEIHGAGLIHGCVTARNVLFGDSDVHLVDMTFVPPVREAAPKRYRAPELSTVAHEPSARRKMDLYGLGVVLFELGTGMEFPGVFRAADLGGTALEPISSVVARLLERDPNARYNDAREVLHDLSVVIGDQATSVDRLEVVPAAPTADYEVFAAIEDQFVGISQKHVRSALETQAASAIAEDAMSEAAEVLSSIAGLKGVTDASVRDEIHGLTGRLEEDVPVEQEYVAWRARQVGGLLAAHWVALVRESVAAAGESVPLADYLLPWSLEHAPSLRREQQEEEFEELVSQLVIDRDAVNAILEEMRKHIEHPATALRLPGGVAIERRNGQLVAVMAAS